jgi:hypothetical protein
VSRPPPLEIHAFPPAWPGLQHHAYLYDPRSQQVLLTGSGASRDDALKDAARRTGLSRYWRRRVVVIPEPAGVHPPVCT